MKKPLLFVLLLTAFSVATLKAQFTIRLATGYAWPGFTNTESVTGPKIDAKTPAEDGLVPMANIVDKVMGGDSIYQPVHGSYGKGVNVTLGLGYMINRYFGFDLGISFLKSASISCNQYKELYLEDPVSPTGFDATGSYLNCKISTNVFGISLMPSIVVAAAKPGWKVYPYARLGLSMPVFGKSLQNVDITLDSAFANSPAISKSPYFLGVHTKVTLETQGSASLGFNGALGVSYRPIPLISVFAEVNGQYLTVKAKSSKITQWESDGTDKIPDRGVYRTQFNYVDQLTSSSNNAAYNANYDATKPKEDIRPTAAFSNLGFNVGITFYIGKEKKKKKDEPATKTEETK
ncbi:MAG TPA: outer membrane beta-barrel protein [Chitinophagales bacterium]|nr:outer membrane beta-barrel protein [Chitinophagales bacterium]